MSYICEKCGKTVEDSEKFGAGRFCSRSCANGHKHSEETKQNIRKGVLKETSCKCQFCGRLFNNLTAKASHERLCEKNPNKLINAGAEARKSASAKANYKVRNGDILDVSNEFIQDYLEEHKTCEICGKTIEESCR
jgi:predicted nucleic acid-binding Zn ribbon protein